MPRLRLTVLLLLGAAATILLGLLLFPFLPALVTSGVLATLSYPAHRKLRKSVKQEDFAAFLSTAAVFFLVLLPALGFSIVLINQIIQGVDWLAGVMEEVTAPGGPITAAWQSITARLGLEMPALGESLSDELSGLLGLLGTRTLQFLSGLGGWLLQAGAALFALFYFIRDGDGLMRRLTWLVPLDREETEYLIERTRNVIYATVYGNIVVAVVQGGLGGLVFWALGIPAAALWGTLMGILSLLPVVGPPIVWLPAVLILLGAGDVVRAVVLFALGAGVIGTVDNPLRAILIGDRAHLHSLVVFFSVLAGLFAFGAIGVIVGPVLFVIAFSLIEMARLALDIAEEERPLAEAAGGEGPDLEEGMFTSEEFADEPGMGRVLWSRMKSWRQRAAPPPRSGEDRPERPGDRRPGAGEASEEDSEERPAPPAERD